MDRLGSGSVYGFGAFKRLNYRLWAKLHKRSRHVDKCLAYHLSTSHHLLRTKKMRFISSVAPVLALAAYAFAEGASDVLNLDATNFKSLVDPEEMILVEFFAPWYADLHTRTTNTPF